MNNNQKITIIASIGMFLSTLDTGIVSIAIPYLSHIFHASENKSILIVSAYSMMLCGTMLIWGYIASRKGVMFVFNIGIIAFLMTSILCALSTSIEYLILARALQGMAGAMIQATALSLISQYIGKEHIKKAIAVVITIAGVGPILGPILGGFILSHYYWQALFALNVPVCLGSLLLSKTKRIVVARA